MKLRIAFLLKLCCVVALAADLRIRDIPTTATEPAADDYVPLSGETNGSRKILGLNLRPVTLSGSNTFLSGSSVTFAAGSNLTVSGAFNGTPTGGTLNLSALTLTLSGYAKTTHGGLEERQEHGTMGATETFDLATANAHVGTLDANLTVTLTGFTNGKYCSMIIGLLQNGTGGWTVTWPAAVVTAPTLSTTAGEITWVSLWSIDGGTTIYATSTYDGVPNNTALAGSWNGDTTTAPTRNAVHDAFAAIDSDLDGKVDAIDNVSTAGLLPVNASGVPGQARTITGTANRILVTNADGQSGDPTLDIGADVVTKASRIVTFVLTIDDLADSLNYDIGFVGAAFTVTEIRAVHIGTGLSSPSVVATVKHGTNRTSGTTIEAVTVTSSTTGTSVTTGFDDATIPQDSWIWVETSGKSGTTDNITIIVRGTYD